MRRFLLAAVAVSALLAPAARAADPIGSAIPAWRSAPVYAAPGGSGFLSPSDANELRDGIAGGGDRPIYVAVLPRTALAEAGGSPDGVLARIANGIGDGSAAYAVVVGGKFRA